MDILRFIIVIMMEHLLVVAFVDCLSKSLEEYDFEKVIRFVLNGERKAEALLV